MHKNDDDLDGLLSIVKRLREDMTIWIGQMREVTFRINKNITIDINMKITE